MSPFELVPGTGPSAVPHRPYVIRREMTGISALSRSERRGSAVLSLAQLHLGRHRSPGCRDRDREPDQNGRHELESELLYDERAGPRLFGVPDQPQRDLPHEPRQETEKHTL